ncbi:MAG: hypothetical protein IT337_13740 [Thermomicrobiales bacterium]|nr:hypothetical protein [Thermomicrobiales bacterium]
MNLKHASTDLRGPSKPHLKPAIGTGQCLCMGCGEAFNSVSAFDRHQRIGSDGRTICLHPLEITDRNGNPKPMVRNARGWWVTSLRDMGDQP